MSATLLPDGIYLGLAKATYFLQRRLGSTDLKTCLSDAANWWYGNPRTNPDYQAAEHTTERDFGEALHVLILEGQDAYDRQILTRPSHYLDPKTGEMKLWNGNAGVCKEWLAEHKDDERTVITADAERRIRHMAALILNHPQYKEPLRQGLAEVSVLFQVHGVACRARIDYLLPQFIIDLKSYGGHSRGRDHRDKALRIIAERHYDIQRYLYDRAREAMVGLIREGRIYGATPEQIEWLQRLAEEPEWSWVWIFYQRRDDRLGRAPIVLPIERPHLDKSFDTGREKTIAAIANYQGMLKKFGLETPWATIEPMWRPNDHDFPSWLGDFTRAAANDDEPTEEEVA